MGDIHDTISYMDDGEKLPYKLALCSLLNSDIWYGMLKTYWKTLVDINLLLVGVIAPPRRGFWSPFGGVCSLTYCNGNFRVTMVSEPFNVIL